MAFGIPGLELSEREKARFAAEDAARHAKEYGYSSGSSFDRDQNSRDDDADIFEKIQKLLFVSESKPNSFRNCTKCAHLGNGCTLHDSTKCGSFTPKYQ